MSVRIRIVLAMTITVAACAPSSQAPGSSGGDGHEAVPVSNDYYLISFDFRTRTEQVHNFVSAAPATDAPSVRSGNISGERSEPVPLEFTGFHRVASATDFRHRPTVNMMTPAGIKLCSGTMIGARTVLTAAHCVLAGNGLPRNWFDDIDVFPAQQLLADPFGVAHAEVAYVYSKAFQEGAPAHDVAVIVVDRPVGYLTGWRIVGHHPHCSFWTSPGWTVIGYPGAPNPVTREVYDDRTMVEMNGTHETCGSPLQLLASFEGYSVGGMSGSGVMKDFTKDGVTYQDVVFGVHTRGDDGGGTSVRLDRFKLDSIGWIRDSHRPVGPDLVLLDFDVPDTEIRPGYEPTGASVLLVNIGSQLLDRPFGFQVYHSEDPHVDEDDTLVQSVNPGARITLAPGETQRYSLDSIPIAPPTPATRPGAFYIGLHFQIDDANDDNNWTRGSDAARVKILSPKEPDWEGRDKRVKGEPT